MSHVKHLFMSCLLAFTAIGLQAATPAPAAKVEAPAPQPVLPLTITVKQTGEASWKTFYKVPVEITVTNNTDKVMYLDFADFVKNFPLNDRTTRRLLTAAAATGISLVILSAIAKLLIGKYGFYDVALFFGCIGVTRRLPALQGLFMALTAAGIINGTVFHLSHFGLGIGIPAFVFAELFLIFRTLQPHATKTFKRSLNASDLQKIRDGVMPELVTVIA